MTAQDIETGSNQRPTLLERLPHAVRTSLTMEQCQALSSATEPASSGYHPVDLRMTLPVPGHPVFLSVVAGHERRSPERRRHERQRHPLRTVGNVVFMLSSLTGVYAVALFAFLVFGSVLEF